jgi:hypothetical protein
MISFKIMALTNNQMAQYYKNRWLAIPHPTDGQPENKDADKLSEFDRHRKTLLSSDAEEGWASELRRYLGTVPDDVTKDTDLVLWWQVRHFTFLYTVYTLTSTL